MVFKTVSSVKSIENYKSINKTNPQACQLCYFCYFLPSPSYFSGKISEFLKILGEKSIFRDFSLKSSLSMLNVLVYDSIVGFNLIFDLLLHLFDVFCLYLKQNIN